MKLFNHLFSRIGRVSPDIVSLVMFVWLVVAVMLPNLVLAFTEGYNGWSVAAGLVLPLGIYLLLPLFTRRVSVVMLVLLPVLLLCVVQVVLLYLYGNSIIAVDMFTNIMTTNTIESRELLGGLAPIIVAICLIYLPLLYFAFRHLWDVRYSLSERARKGVVLVGAVLTIAGVQLLYPAGRVADDERIVRSELFPVNVMHNLRLAVGNRVAERNYHHTSAAFNHAASRSKSSPQREIYLLVIGESSRAANWELYGYERTTNPRLRKRDNLCIFRNVITQSNTTHKSVPMILSSVDAENFAELYCRKGLADMFRQAGFRTYFLSTQSPQGAMVDNLAQECNEVIYIATPGYDLQMVQMVQRIVESEPECDLLFILHSYGSHYRYNQRYTADMALFLPDGDAMVNGRNVATLRNAYDNSILYTDCLLDSLAGYLDTVDACSAMLYCSDHGEDLFDDGRGMFLHSSPRVTYYQLHVPCLAWFSQAYCDRYPSKVAMAHRHRWSPTSTAAMFHTMADMASVESPYADDRKSLTCAEFDDTAPRLYLNDRNCAVRLDRRIGISDLDRREFLLHGIRLD